MSNPQPAALSGSRQPLAKNKILWAYSTLFAGILCLSLSSLFVRWANAPGVVTSFYRMTLATLVMSPLLVIQAKRQGSTASGKWAWAALLPAVLGGLFTSLDHATWSTSIGFTRVANATLLNNTAPIWVALFAYFVFKEKLQKFFWLGLALTMAGAIAMLASDLLSHPILGWGDLLALGSGVFYAAYFLVTQRARRQLNVFVYMAVVDLVACLCLLFFCLVFGQPLSGYSWQTYLVFVGAALISQVGGYLSLSYALGYLPAFVVAPTMIAQPVLTALLAIPLLGEGLAPVQWLGGLAVLGGIALVNRFQ